MQTLGAYVEAARAQTFDESLHRLRTHTELHEAGWLAQNVVNTHVFQVDVKITGGDKESTELTGLISDDDGDRVVIRGVGTVLAGDPRTTRDSAFQSDRHPIIGRVGEADEDHGS